MGEQGIRELIVSTIEREVATTSTKTRFRKPLVGFAEVNRQNSLRIKRTVGEHHLLLDELLPGAQTVVAFFVPFPDEAVSANKAHPFVAREWAVAYAEGNKLISHICESLVRILNQEGIRAAWEPPTHNFDKVNLVSRWSHKTMASLAGLGSFGLNRLLITDAGCAGRFGSFLLGARLAPDHGEPKQCCLYFHDASCVECIELCPVGALEEQGDMNRAACYRHLLEVDAFFSDLPPTSCCGKCSVGPCALQSAV